MDVQTEHHGGSASIGEPDYWWYRVRSHILATVLEEWVGDPGRVLDVGSADGPSVAWLRRYGTQTPLDLDPRGLEPGGVCGSALNLPFADSTFDLVAAFDVLEHCEPEGRAVDEFARVLVPGGRLLMSVPAYEWAWSDFDEENGHHRRYTRKRAVRAVERSGLVVERATYAFATVFPAFAAERMVRRVRRLLRSRDTATPADVVSLPKVSPALDKLLSGMSRLDTRVLATRDLPFGSSVVLVARKPDDQSSAVNVGSAG